MLSVGDVSYTESVAKIQTKTRDGDHDQPRVDLRLGDQQILNGHGNGKQDLGTRNGDPFGSGSGQDAYDKPRD